MCEQWWSFKTFFTLFHARSSPGVNGFLRVRESSLWFIASYMQAFGMTTNWVRFWDFLVVSFSFFFVLMMRVSSLAFHYTSVVCFQLMRGTNISTSLLEPCMPLSRWCIFIVFLYRNSSRPPPHLEFLCTICLSPESSVLYL